jgi:hypothetical protein
MKRAWHFDQQLGNNQGNNYLSTDIAGVDDEDLACWSVRAVVDQLHKYELAVVYLAKILVKSDS